MKQLDTALTGVTMMKVGRNDPCPCGSGKKFKKCCIDKPEYRHPAAVSATIEKFGHAKAAASMSPFDAESLLDIAGQQIDSTTVDMLRKAVADAKLERVTEIDEQIEQLTTLSADDILTKLSDTGTIVDEPTFVAAAIQLHSSLELSETWTGEPWAPFAYAAAAYVLWERWCPDVFCWEHFNDLILRGYEAQQWIDSSEEICVFWQQAWDELSAFATVQGMDDIGAVMDEGRRYLLEDPSDWVQDFAMELQDASLHNPNFGFDLLAFTRHFVQVFPNSDDEIVYNMRLAEGDALFLVNDPAAGDAHFEAMIAADPTNAWPYVHWGDNYLDDSNRVTHSTASRQKAYEIYNRGLRHATQDVDELEQRVRD